MASRCNGKFVSQKIRKIRWKPMPAGAVRKADVFVTGSWQNEPNALTTWQRIAPPDNDGEMFAEGDPKMIHKIPHIGDVTDIKYLNNDSFLSSSSTGTVSVYKHAQNDVPMLQMTYERMHYFPARSAPCTALDSHGENFVSIGEDGCLIHYSLKKQQPVRRIDADSSTLTATSYLKQNEVITSNSQGQLALWDLRGSGEPTRILSMGGELTAVLCMSHHPTRPSVLACGNEDGTLCIWDLRNHQYPATVLSAHSGPVLEIKFHPLSPNHLFTCSMDGMIWHWDSSALVNSTMITRLKGRHAVAHQPDASSSPWIECGASKHHLEICSLLPSSNKPINSLDILDDVLLCGSDNEAFRD